MDTNQQTANYVFSNIMKNAMLSKEKGEKEYHYCYDGEGYSKAVLNEIDSMLDESEVKYSHKMGSTYIIYL